MTMRLATATARRREDDSLVASMNALRRFEADREARAQQEEVQHRFVPAASRQQQVQEAYDSWREQQAERLDEVQRAAWAEAELNEAERRRYEAEVFAAVVASSTRPRVWLRASALGVMLVGALAAGAAFYLEQQASEQAARDASAALAGERQALAREGILRAQVTRMSQELASLREQQKAAADAPQGWPAVTLMLPDPAPAAARATPPAAPAVVTTPLVAPAAIPAPEPAPATAPAAASDDAAKAKRSARHTRHSEDAKDAKDEPGPVRPAKAPKLCPPNQPICR